MAAEADSDFIKDWDTYWTSPQKKKTKKKKKYKKDENDKRIKGDIALEKECSILKKKKQKNPKFKEVMKKKKEVMKKKKKNTKKDKESLNLELDESFTLTQDDSAPIPVSQFIRPEQISAIKSATSNSHSDMQAKDKVTNYFISPKTAKSKKKVAFHLSPGYISAKHPRVISQPPQAKDSYFSESQVMRDDEKLQYGTQTGQSQSQPQGNDSQSTGDDAYSQDLFITQKTFRCSSSEPSSSENMEEGISSIPLTLSEQFRGKRPPPSHLMLNHAASDRHRKHLQKHAQHELPQLHQEMRKPKKEKPGQNVIKLTEEKNQMSPPCLKPTNKPSLFPLISTTNTSTQTENFFTTELSFFLRFCQESKVTESSEDLKPVDLSLPQRTRAQLGSCLSCSGKTSALGVKDVTNKHGNQHPSSSPIEIKDESEEELIYSPGDNKEKKRGKDEPPPSSQSEPEPKSTDTTSSEDSERTGKFDLTQVRAVQTRLNESFFFKMKGDGHSHRPDSPLMKSPLKFPKAKKSRRH